MKLPCGCEVVIRSIDLVDCVQPCNVAKVLAKLLMPEILDQHLKAGLAHLNANTLLLAITKSAPKILHPNYWNDTAAAFAFFSNYIRWYDKLQEAVSDTTS